MHLGQQMPSASHSLGTCVLALPALPWPLQQAKFMVQVLNKNRRPSSLNHTNHFIRFLDSEASSSSSVGLPLWPTKGTPLLACLAPSTDAHSLTILTWLFHPQKEAKIHHQGRRIPTQVGVSDTITPIGSRYINVYTTFILGLLKLAPSSNFKKSRCFFSRGPLMFVLMGASRQVWHRVPFCWTVGHCFCIANTWSGFHHNMKIRRINYSNCIVHQRNSHLCHEV